ncbi:MAG: hypothetical protein IJZ37_01940 [Clostridia bacterium]|nr:hypothetical protein [Clostridia bacterium]
MNFNIDNLLTALPLAGIGWLGIFIVVLIVIILLYAMNGITKMIEGKKNNKDSEE